MLNLSVNFIKYFKKILFPFYKNKELKFVFKKLHQDYPEEKIVARFVGGCVRKYLTGDKIDDIDIATILTSDEIKLKFKNTNFKAIDTGINHGTITLVSKNFKLELTTLRKDTKTDGRHAEVEYIDDWKIDSERRDFTINAIYLDIKGKIFDPQKGTIDLKNKNVKFIGNPQKRIEEDYLRIIRYLRFCVQYNIQYSDPKIINAIKLNLNGIKNLSKERILNELYKIFNLKNINILFENEEIKNIFLLIFPEFKYLKRLKKYTFFESPKLIFSILLVDEKDNYEYFCHKYKTSNSLKRELNFIAKNYIKFYCIDCCLIYNIIIHNTKTNKSNYS